MNVRRLVRTVVLAALLAAPTAWADGVDTILRRPLDPAANAVILGPTRLQGDFAPHLDDVLAQAVPDSSAAFEAAPAPDSLPAPAAALPRAERQPTVLAPILGGAVGGFAGLYGGAVAGLLLSNDDGGEWDEFAAALGGAFIGETFLLPAGVHLGNARKGSYGIDLLISVTSGLAGIALGSLIGGDGAGLIAGAGFQLGTVVLAERNRGRLRIAARQAAAAP